MFIAKLVKTKKPFFPSRMRLDKHWLALITSCAPTNSPSGQELLNFFNGGSEMRKGIVSAVVCVIVAVGFVACGGGGGGGGDTTIICANDQQPLLVIIPSAPADLFTPVGAVGRFTAMATCPEWTATYVLLNGDVNWESSNTIIATVETTELASILATGLSSGTSLISATWKDLSTSTTLTVTSEILLSIDSLAPENQFLQQGSSEHLFVHGTFSDNATHRVIPTLFSWTSSNTGVATIDAAGIATSVSPGSCLITATTGTISQSTTLTVTNPPAHD